MPQRSVNPATGESSRDFPEPTAGEVEAMLETARTTFGAYRFTSMEERAGWLRRAAGLLDADETAFARTMVEEMGKTRRAAIAEVRKCAAACRHYADHGARYLADEPIATEDGSTFVRYLPLGPVLAIMPWNFPFWQVIRFAAPALMAGNVGLLKHASNVPQCALALESLFRRAGFPDGAFQTLLIGVDRTAEVIADPRIRAVTLTGSERAGAEVASLAGRHLKKVVLELGGSDPFVVMPSADLEEAVRVAVTARLLNNGQSCIAAKRFLVHERIYPEFEAKFVAALRRARVGDPMDDATELGPLATLSGRDTLHAQVRDAVAAGARLLVGGEPMDGPGYHYPATALADIPTAARAYREEVFGPVALLFRVRDLDHAIALANASDYGLGSSVWTQDPLEQQRFVDELEAGQTFVNAMVASDPRVPFGGVKRSGHGRELGAFGIREFTNPKTIHIGRPRGSRPGAE